MRLNRFCVAVLAIAAPSLCFATSTRTWLQSSAQDFEKGDLHGLAVRSDGRLTLAPQSQELVDAGMAYLWALARNSKGDIYAGGGPGAKVYRIGAGKPEVVAQFDALEVHALAINSKDEVFAATSPDGRIYRIPASGKPVEFYNPHQKYIWALAFDAAGNLFAATGDQGEIHRITPDGRGSVFFKSEETHIRSLAMGNGTVYAGTDPSGLILRINAKGEGFVLFQMPKHEVTALALTATGALFAADAGTQPVAAPPASTPAVPPAPAASGTIAIALSHAGQASAAPPATFTGGSDIYRIQPDGYPQQLWTSTRDVVYSLAIDAEGLPIAATGNHGALLRIDSPTRVTTLLTLPTSQILGLIAGKPGEYFAATGNIGKVYHIGPQREQSGTWESDVFDSGAFTQWGRVISYGDEHGGKITLEARSGNQDRPNRNWSEWSAPVTGKTGGRANAPPARYLQVRATLTGSTAGAPELDSLEAAYRAQNAAPLLGEIEITPPNYKFPGTALAATPSRSPAAITLPAIGHASSGHTASDVDSSALIYAKGWLGARWTASDPNGDPLSYSVAIRGVQERDWKPLKDRIGDRHYSFDSTAFSDGEYRLRLTASDQPGNTAADALTAEIVSAPFTIDNTPPAITALQARSTAAQLEVTWRAQDALNILTRAEYSLDGGDWLLVEPQGKLSDSLALNYQLTLPLVQGEHTIAVRVTDDADNIAVAKTVIVK
jgi:hypothetical protein